MRTLVVAAGGGGDALGALLLGDLLPGIADPPLIATMAWERLRIDPLPGPRGADGFIGLGDVGGRRLEVLPRSDTSPRGHSSLPRLTSETSARIFLLDPHHGVVGLTDQLEHLVHGLEVDHVVVVDIGGDAIASGSEPGLASPLADAMILAAVVKLACSVELVVAGPGLDAELDPTTVEGRVRALGGRRMRAVASPTARLLSVLDWHPTEASALLASAAGGVAGRVEMRRGEGVVELTARSARAWRFEPAAAVNGSQYALAVAGSRSLDDAEAAAERVGPTELGYEREKASTQEGLPPVNLADLAQLVPHSAREALSRGADLTTTRRIAEVVGVPGNQTGDLIRLLNTWVDARCVALWNLHVLAHDQPADRTVRAVLPNRSL